MVGVPGRPNTGAWKALGKGRAVASCVTPESLVCLNVFELNYSSVR